MDEQVSPGLSMTEYLFLNPQRNEINFPYSHQGKLELGWGTMYKGRKELRNRTQRCVRYSNYPLVQ